MIDADTAKTAIEISAPLIATYLESYVKPLIVDSVKSKRKDVIDINYLSSYYSRAFEKF